MHEVTLSELVELVDDPFVRRQVSASSFTTAWVAGEAAVVAAPSRRNLGPGAAYTCVGPAADLDPLLASVAEVAPAPGRVSVDKHSFGALPWRVPSCHVWDWMLCDTPPPPALLEVVEVADPAEEVGAVLDAGNPDSFARPGDPDVETWLGAYDDGVLGAVGALTRVGDGTGHLRGITTRPDHRGRGLGAAVSAALTRRAMAPTGVATLGVYVDNDPALAIYRRLGFRTVHTFASGAVTSAR